MGNWHSLLIQVLISQLNNKYLYKYSKESYLCWLVGYEKIEEIKWKKKHKNTYLKKRKPNKIRLYNYTSSTESFTKFYNKYFISIQIWNIFTQFLY